MLLMKKINMDSNNNNNDNDNNSNNNNNNNNRRMGDLYREKNRAYLLF